MNRILEEITAMMTDSIRTQLSEVPLSGFEEDGTVYYMNGKNGTEFDWHVNGKLSDFFIFYNDEANLGAVKTRVNCDGSTITYVYTDKGKQLKAEIPGSLDASEAELLQLAVTLRREADDRRIWDMAVKLIDTDVIPTEEQIQEFVENRQYYEGMIQRMNIMGQFSYVSRMVLDDNLTIGYMCRDEGLHDQDSGWSFMAGVEDDAYIDDAQNIALLHVGSVCQMDPAVWKFIDAPAGSSFIRISAEEFEEDKGDKEIWIGKREQGEA